MIDLDDEIDSYREQRKTENVLGNLDINSALYRIFSFSRFREVLVSKQLCLVKPYLWDDPFENFLLSTKVYSKDGIKIDLERLRNTVFGQCWTLHYETDAMWRIYSHDKCGIKVKANAKKLFESFYENSESPELRCYIGKVDYLEDNNIIKNFTDPDRAHNILLNDNTGSELPKTLLVKRVEFEHEKEVRLLYTTITRDDVVKNESYCFPIDANELFEEIVIDPRLEPSHFNEICNELVRLGYKNDIKQSSLYKIDFPKIELDITLGIAAFPSPKSPKHKI